MRPSNNVNPHPILPQPISNRRTLPIKRADAEPLSRVDIQYDLLAAIFNDRHAFFTVQLDPNPDLKKITFRELYTSALIASPRCSKVLREKMIETPEFAVDFAKIALLANVGRINTTMAFFPEMRTVLRSYHPIPSLQKTDANLQDAPRIKNCLKACLLHEELSNPPCTPADIIAKGQAGIIPTTSVVNLIFVLSNHSVSISRAHFEAPFDFLDLFLPVNASSTSRARAFLWLMFHYLESPSLRNPFADDDRPDKVPRLQYLTTRQRLLENVDTEDEIQYGRRMAQYRSKFLQKQIADEEKDKQMFGGALIKTNFKITTPAEPIAKYRAPSNEIREKQTLDSRRTRGIPHRTYSGIGGGHPVRHERSMLEHAWNMAINADPLLNSDEDVDLEYVMIDYERRVQILNAKVRGKALTPEPQVDRVCVSNSYR